MSWKTRLVLLTVAAAFVTGCVVLYTITPEKTWWMPPCMFNKLTGLYCPGCGTARAYHKLLHGDFMGAMRMNPLSVAFIPLIAYLLLITARGTRTGNMRMAVWLPIAILVVIIVFWIVRNIPAYPFTVLAPH